MTYVPDWIPQPPASDALAYAKEIAFASIVVAAESGPAASHAPIYVDTSATEPEIRFHLAAKNPMVDLLAASPTLLIFRGPDGYVSPLWYDHENVPTWDYKFVHLSGVPRPLDRGELKNHVMELVEHFDDGLPIKGQYVEQLLDDIRGFAITQPHVQPVFKLSQDKSRASIDAVVAGYAAAETSNWRAPLRTLVVWAILAERLSLGSLQFAFDHKGDRRHPDAEVRYQRSMSLRVPKARMPVWCQAAGFELLG